MAPANLDEAIRSAESLQNSVSAGGIDVAYHELEKSLVEFESQGYPIDSILLQEEPGTLGFAKKLKKTKEGKSFWQLYKEMIKKRLCQKTGELNKLIKSGIHASVGAVLTAIVAGLGLPGAALVVLIPIAVIIFNTGIDAFCAM